MALTPPQESKRKTDNGPLRIKHLSAGCIYGSEGALWATAYSMRTPGAADICCARVLTNGGGYSGRLRRLDPPRKMEAAAVCAAGAPEALWLLSSAGGVHARTGITADEPEGDGWETMDNTQLEMAGASKFQ